MFESEIKERARSLGADLVGIAPADSEHLRDNAESMEAILPGCRSLIVVAKCMNDDALDSGNLKLAQYDSICAYQELDSIMYRTAMHVKDQGHRAVPIPPNMPVDMSPEKRGMYGEVNQKCAATAAGLGNIGVNGLFISPEHGPRLRIGSILTDSYLQPDDPLREKVCTECMTCVERCPTDAIEEDGSVDLDRCMRVSLQYGLPGVVRFGMKASDMSGEELKSHVGSPTLWELWQNLLIGNFNGCFECVDACPIGVE